MRIKRLELVGFKSFVDPTVIDFDAPIVGIVGPNGCGKSNVVDALRWVMGEMSAKSLRGRSMEDVIFNGAEKRQALGLAEVSLTFSTEDGIVPVDYAGFTEITITRRLYRSGESEYLINKIPARLKDIIELFLGTGVGHKAYSIIEQGRIDFAINAKPEDRRLLIEEAAGISKFKARKEAALRKIEGTELNLARLRDILREVSRQINFLDRQVKKAEKYKILKTELRERELKLAGIDYQETSQEIGELKALLGEWEIRETSSSTGLATLENDLDRSRLELIEKDQEFNALQERFFEVSSRLKLLEAQETFQKKEGETLEESRLQAARKIEEMKERLQLLGGEKAELEKRKTEMESHSGASSHLLEESGRECREMESSREALAVRIELLKEERHQLSSEQSRLDGEKRFQEEKRVSLKGQLAKVEVEIAETEKRWRDQESLVHGKKVTFQETTAQCQFLRGKMEELKKRLGELEERKEILAQEVDIRNEELVMKRSRLKSLQDLERNFEGYEEGVRSILKVKKEKGIFGVVAEFVETAPQYEMAVSAALGEKLQYVIVKSHEEGVEAINYLKTQSSGRSSFIPMEVRESEILPYREQEGVIGPLLSKVKLKDGFQAIGQYLLGDVLLVSSLNSALTLWKTNDHKKILVTMDGEVIDPSGVVSGGNADIRGKILLEKKREIRELKTLTAELEEEIGLKEDTLSQFEGSLSEISMDLDQTSLKSQEAEMKRMSLEAETQLLEADLQRLEGEKARFKAERDQFLQEEGTIDQALTACESRRQELIQASREKQSSLETTDQEIVQAQFRLKQAQEKLTTLRVQAAASSEKQSMTEREKDRLLQTEQDLRRRIDQEMSIITEAHQKTNLLQKSISEGVVERTSLKTIFDELAVGQETARGHYETVAGTLKEKEEKVRELRKENDLAKKHAADLRVTLSRSDSDLHHLEQQIFEKYSVSLSSMGVVRGRENSPPDFSETSGSASVERIDRSAEEARVAEMKEQIERLGDVNMGSIPEYEELKTRQEFLTTQIQDLEDSIGALKKAIHRINQTTRTRFEETFAMVNERFQTLFPRLFQGGRAELRLTEAEDMMNTGVELLVQPPGKKLSHVGLLSGGEKAMAAIAFVFSIFLVKPSPFCILDEVDAPLDDLNVTRFHQLLSEIINRTQFILITHNRRTMEKADLLYGVTMQEPGVSQLVSVRLSGDGLKMAS